MSTPATAPATLVSNPDEVTAQRFRPDIQGLRAIAVTAVVLFHAGVPGIRGGYVGVDVFFVISGFLITSHLLATAAHGGGIDFASFFAKRIRRILPAALTVAVLTMSVAVVVYPPIDLPRVIGDALATILFVPNIVFASQATDYLADHTPSPFQHYWSLGVEEQFYVLWPLVVALLLLLSRRGNRSLTLIVALFAGASLVCCLVTTQTEQPAAFFLLTSRAWELLAGALVAIMLLRGRPAIDGRVAASGAWLGLVMIVSAVVFFDASTPFPGAAAILPVAGTTAVLFFGAANPSKGPGGALSIRVLQFLGRVSFSLYLIHWPLLVLAQTGVGEQNPLRGVVKLSIVLAAVPLAWLLWRFVEEPFRGARGRQQRRPVAVIGTAAVVIAVLTTSLVALGHWASDREGTLGPAVAEAPLVPVSPAPTTSAAPSNLVPRLEDALASLPDLYKDGCHQPPGVDEVKACSYGDANASTQVVLFGDSHAAQWLPALQDYAEANAVHVLTYTKSSCPAVEVTVINNDVPDAPCDRWRENVLEVLEASPPDAILIAGSAWYDLADASEAARAEKWSQSVESTVARLAEGGSEVVFMADTPRLGAMSTTCVSANPRDVDRCAADRAVALDQGFQESEKAAAVAGGARYVDLNDFICAENHCPVVVWNLLIYRDRDHLTTPFVHYLAPALAPMITTSLQEAK